MAGLFYLAADEQLGTNYKSVIVFLIAVLGVMAFIAWWLRR